MFAIRMVHLIEDHADRLAEGLIPETDNFTGMLRTARARSVFRGARPRLRDLPQS